MSCRAESFGLRPPVLPRARAACSPSSAFTDQVSEHLVHGTDDVEQEPAGGRGRVNALLEHDEVDVAFMQVGSDLGEIPYDLAILDNLVMTSSSPDRR